MPDTGRAVEAGRLTAVDAARGLAILGVGLCNAGGFATRLNDAETLPHLASAGARGLWVFEQVLLPGRMVALLSLLFGAAMVWVGGDGRDAARTGRLNRRLLWLAVIGLVHGVGLWWGDILLPYAVAGLIVRGVRGWPARRLLVVGGAAYATGVLLLRIDGLVALIGQTPVAIVATQGADLPSGFLPALAALIAGNARDWITAVPLTIASALTTSAPLMLIGMAMARLDLFAPETLKRRAPLFAWAGVAAVLIVLPVALMQASRPSPALAFWAVTLRWLTAPAGALGWLAVAALMGRFQPLWAPIGRLALSAYLSQSLLARVGFALAPQTFGHMGYAALMMAAAVGLIGQWALAFLWDRQGWRGPAEALWRRLYLGAAPTPVQSPPPPGPGPRRRRF